jgi:hypothetical protein
MKYTVVWMEVAQNDLAAIWMAAADRPAVTQAAHRIEQSLKFDAETKGQEFVGKRLLVDQALAVVFTARLLGDRGTRTAYRLTATETNNRDQTRPSC